MGHLTVEIDPAITSQFPDITVGGFVVYGLRTVANRIENSQLLQESIECLSEQGVVSTTLGNNPNIAAWRNAFRLQGLKPSRYRTSPDALARRVLRGDNIQTGLPIVDAYNAVSLRFLTPIGAYDVDRLPGRQIALRFARPISDKFMPLGVKDSSMPLLKTVAVYAMEDDILCWGFNHRDSSIACLQPETDIAAFFSEGVAVQHHEGIILALEKLRQLFINIGAIVGSLYMTNQVGIPLTLL